MDMDTDLTESLDDCDKDWQVAVQHELSGDNLAMRTAQNHEEKLTSTSSSEAGDSAVINAEFSLSKESYKMPNLLEWVRPLLTKYIATKQSELSIRGNHVKFQVAGKVLPKTSNDLLSHACIVDLALTKKSKAHDESLSESATLTASTTGVSKNFKIPKSENDKLAKWLVNTVAEFPRIIGYLGTDWKLNGKNSVQPFKAWCFYVIPSAALEMYKTTNHWPWSTESEWKL
jgi:hypothetical protein